MRTLPKDVDGRNGNRAGWAGKAMQVYLQGPSGGTIEQAVEAWIRCTGTQAGDIICDLLCDLHHWCDREDLDFDSRAKWEKAKEIPRDSVTEFMRALRRWGRRNGESYNEGLRRAMVHYKAETGLAPY